MADVTNADIPTAGGQISGDVTRQAAIKRMQRLQANAPKPAAQKPGLETYSPHPPKPKRI